MPKDERRPTPGSTAADDHSDPLLRTNGHSHSVRGQRRQETDAGGDVPRPHLQIGPYTFKLAETEDEYTQVHGLNYRTFVQELGEYEDNGDDVLVDKFHDKNLYFIGKRDNRVVAMISVHDQPPFSTADRLPDRRALERLGDRILEVRLLAIEPDERNGVAFAGTLWCMVEYALQCGYSHLVISGITDREKMYHRIGFRPLGPAVPKGRAAFIPMALSLADMPGYIHRHIDKLRSRVARIERRRPSRPISLLPGPVQISGVVQRAMREHPESHRGKSFIDRYERIRRHLSELVGGLDTALLNGSGTIANEAIAATLAADRSLRRGLILNNGEFGRRLVTQAKRYDLDFDVLEWDWGRPFDLDAVVQTLRRSPATNWIWAVHLETSTGVLNDLNELKRIAAAHDVRLCLDCVSSLGATPTDLQGVHLASGVSAKSLGSVAGFAFVFVGRNALVHIDNDRVPVYLDIKAAINTVGPRFTCPSLELLALDRALESFSNPNRCRMRYEQYTELGRYVRSRLRQLGIEPMAPEEISAPIITTFRPPPGIDSRDFCEQSLSWGYELAGFSGYLLDRGLLQIATMGAVKKRDCADYFAKMKAWMDADVRAGTPT